MLQLNDEQRAAFARYEQIKEDIKLLEAEAEKLQPIIIPLIPENVEVPSESERGTFIVQRRATWKYSSDHKMMKEALKECEATEKAKGVAKATYKEILVYKSATTVEPGSEPEREIPA